ncbi:thioredoxin family protein [Flavobacterium sp.]|uniref:thioredoxin family protein n=1 Tax=Flavobacterium sp. TaxID=239 RepID=UPI00261EDE80|nr:thioredoxin family protein [Flavobacterium sp.]
MKSMLSLMLLCGSIMNSNAQQWIRDLDFGLKEAAQQNKKVLLFFSVPEHCDTCVKLEQKVFKSPEFLAFADDNYVMVKIDFSYQQDDKEQLQKNLLIVEKYNKDGFFPHVVVLNKEAKIALKTGVYNNETPQEYLSLLKKNTKS